MITSKLIALEKQIASAIPGFAIKRTFMIARPVGQVVCGINFDRSAYDQVSFSVTAFAMPLCVPAEHFGFTFGVRIRHERGGDRWGMDMPELEARLIAALKQQAMPFLYKSKSLQGFIEVAKAGSRTGRTLEGLGYALARSGDAKQAIEVFNQIPPMLNLDIAWQRELADRVRTLSVELVEHPEEAQNQLAQTEAQTVRNLGLEGFRDFA
jgi:hypothetical protein